MTMPQWGHCDITLQHVPLLKSWCKKLWFSLKQSQVSAKIIQLSLVEFMWMKKKTKIQNLGSGDPATDIMVEGNTVEAVTKFRYLDPYSHPPADATHIYIDALEWPPLPCMKCSAVGDNRDWVWTPNCDFTKPVFFRFCCAVPTHGPYWQMISAGCSLFTWDASVRHWASDGRITWSTST